MDSDEQLKNLLGDYMLMLDFVQWDRYTHDFIGIGQFEEYKAYGWIDREEDSYKDFVVLTITQYTEDSHEISYVTSSAKYTEEIAEVLEIDGNHCPCIRIEETFTIPNMITLPNLKKI